MKNNVVSLSFARWTSVRVGLATAADELDFVAPTLVAGSRLRLSRGGVGLRGVPRSPESIFAGESVAVIRFSNSPALGAVDFYFGAKALAPGGGVPSPDRQ